VEETRTRLDQFEKLLQSGTVGPIKTRNRMLKTANGTSLMEDNQTVGPRMVAYDERLAKGGVGYVVVESSGGGVPAGYPPRDKRVFVLEGKNVITTQDWGSNIELIDELAGLAGETHVVGSSREPGWIVDAIREGALAGYSV
jgi:hypothetical protein